MFQQDTGTDVGVWCLQGNNNPPGIRLQTSSLPEGENQEGVGDILGEIICFFDRFFQPPKKTN